MSSYLSSLLSAFGGGRGGVGGAAEDEDFSDFEDAGSVENHQPLNKGPAVGAAAGSSKDPSVHWLSVRTTETEAAVVCEKAAADHLVKVGAETALALVSIFGGARQGKSFLMNMLAGAGDDRLFKISNSKVRWSRIDHLAGFVS